MDAGVQLYYSKLYFTDETQVFEIRAVLLPGPDCAKLHAQQRISAVSQVDQTCLVDKLEPDKFHIIICRPCPSLLDRSNSS